MELACPKCAAPVVLPEAQRNQAKVLLKCTACEHMFVWKREDAPPAAEPAAAPAPEAAPEPEPVPEAVPAPVPAAAAPKPEAPPPAAPKPAAPAAPAAAPLPPASGVRWTPPASNEYVLVVRDWAGDKAKHLAAKLLMERGVGRLNYEQHKKQFETPPFVLKKIPADLNGALSKLLADSQSKFETAPAPLMLCAYHANDLKAGNCAECARPLCAVCLKESPVCRDCRDRQNQAARRSVEEQRSKVRVVTDPVLLGDLAQLRVIGVVTAETMCDEHQLFDSLTKAMKGTDHTVLEQAKDQALSRLQFKALELGATAVCDFRLTLTSFQGDAIGKSFVIIQASGTALG